MRLAKSLGQSSLSLSPESYIYTIKPVADGLVASCSDDSIRIIDKTLSSGSTTTIANCHEGITALATSPSTPHIAITSGRDGFFRSWDLRSKQKVSEGQSDSKSSPPAPITALAISPLSNQLAIGTELTNHEAVVTVWDSRSLKAPVVSYKDCHTDDVTELAWHPTDPSFLLSGSTDGLLQLYDTRIADEDDAVVRTFNHGSVSHATWPEQAGVREGHETIYAVSHDEQLARYRIPLGGDASHYKPVDDEDADNEALTVGDVRPKFDCEYVIDFLSVGGSMVVGVGKHSEKRVDLIDLTESLEAGVVVGDSTIRLEGAHGEEIVRAFFVDGETDTIYTGGEDGMLRAWRTGDEDVGAAPAKQLKDRGKEKKGESRGKRFAPY